MSNALVLGWLFIGVVAVLLTGWVVPVIVGIIRLRRRTGGPALLIIGGVWFLGAAGVVGLGVVWYRTFSAGFAIKDFDPAGHAGQTGTVALPHKGESSLVVGDEAQRTRLRLRVRDGAAVAPAGRFQVFSYTATAKAGDGAG